MPRYKDLNTECTGVAAEHADLERQAGELRTRIAAGEDDRGGLAERLANVERGVEQRAARYKELHQSWQDEMRAALDRGELSTEAVDDVSPAVAPPTAATRVRVRAAMAAHDRALSQHPAVRRRRSARPIGPRRHRPAGSRRQVSSRSR
jgi:hypothetical protein